MSTTFWLLKKMIFEKDGEEEWSLKKLCKE
jgi:hypothetical protein